MKLNPRVARMVIICVSMVAGSIVGIIGFGPAIANTLSNQSEAPVYQKNENGQTYGSAANATSIETEPDLILAEGVDGTIGYVRSVDLNGVMPKTPEEAVELMSKRTEGVREIKLYAVDGKTVIGTFEVQEGNVKMVDSDGKPID